MSRLTKWNAESGQPVRLDVALQLKAELDEALARLEEENRELAQALKSVLDCITETRGPNAFVAVADAKEILAKHQTHKKEAGHE